MENFLTHSKRPATTMIQKADKDTRKKKNCKWISHEIGAKILSKIPADQIQNHMKRIIHQGLEYIHLG